MEEPPPENEQEHGINNQQAKVRPHIFANADGQN
jgi:hypothetical protein